MRPKFGINEVFGIIYFIFIGIVASLLDGSASGGQKFVLGLLMIQYIFLAKDIAPMFLKYLFGFDSSIVFLFRGSTSNANKFTIVFFALLFVLLGGVAWIVSWEGKTGIPYGLGSIVGAWIYEFCISPYISRSKVDGLAKRRARGGTH